MARGKKKAPSAKRKTKVRGKRYTGKKASRKIGRKTSRKVKKPFFVDSLSDLELFSGDDEPQGH